MRSALASSTARNPRQRWPSMRSVSFFAGRWTFLRCPGARRKSGRRARYLSRPAFGSPGEVGVTLYSIASSRRRLRWSVSSRNASSHSGPKGLHHGATHIGVRPGVIRWADTRRAAQQSRELCSPGRGAIVQARLALRSEVQRRGQRSTLRPVLFYLYAEPEVWPASGEAVDGRAKARHRDEIETFAAAVVDDEVRFVPCTWRRLLEAWADQPDSRIRAHAVTTRFSP